MTFCPFTAKLYEAGFETNSLEWGRNAAPARGDEQIPLNFDDAYQYVAATSREQQLFSFSNDFHRTDIERWEPADLLGQYGK